MSIVRICNLAGLPEDVTDSAGHIIWRGRYTIWGKLVYEHNTHYTPTGFSQPLRMQGQYDDGNTGLYYNTFRYYDAEAGRYACEDPIGLKGGINLYKYVNNPTEWADPLGLLNFTKSLVSFVNTINAGRLYAAGVLKYAAAAGLTSTGAGSPVGAVAVGIGTWNFASAKSAWSRANQQWNEALIENWSDASWRNFLGVLPFGSEYDDPCEPWPIDVLSSKIQNFSENSLDFIIELGTLGL